MCSILLACYRVCWYKILIDLIGRRSKHRPTVVAHKEAIYVFGADNGKNVFNDLRTEVLCQRTAMGNNPLLYNITTLLWYAYLHFKM